jgi:HlyD family secretion protein
VTRGSITNVLTLDGVVAPREQTPLIYQWKAIVDNINVKAGQAVKQGDALIDFNTGDIPKTLDDARVRLQNSQVQLAQAEARQQTAAQKAVSDQAQKDQAVLDAQAGLQAAQANLASVQAGRPQADRVAQESAVSYGNAQLKQAQDELDALMAGPDEQTIRAAEVDLAKYKAALQAAQADFAILTKGPDAAAVRAAENALQRAQVQLKIAQSTKPDTKIDPAVAALQHDAAVQDAQNAVDSAQVALDKLKTPPSDSAVKIAQQKVQDAQQNVEAAQAKLDALQNGPDPAAINAAQTNIEHIKHYIGEATANLNEVLSHPTPQELAAAQDQLRKAQSALDNARRAAEAPADDGGNDMNALQDAVTQNQADVTRLEQQLADTHIRAPFDGVVVAVRIKIGDSVTPGKPLVTLAKPGAPLVRVDLSGSDPSQVAVGQPARVQLDNGTSSPTSLDASVTGIVPAAVDGSTAAAALLNVAWPDGQTPKFGTAVETGITVGQKDGVLVLPLNAIHKSGSRATVEVQDGTLRRLVTVQVGITNSDSAEIVSGLNEGQTVLVAPGR